MTVVGSLPAPPRVTGVVRTAVVALGAQAGLALAYLALTGAGVTAVPWMAVPFVWTTVAVVAVAHVDGPAVAGRSRAVAVAVGGGYGLALAWVAGLFAVGDAGGDVTLALLPPWWGPVLRSHGVVALTLFPYRVVGYGALGYLAYAAAGDALAGDSGVLSGSAGGLLAVLSCVGCAVPLLSVVTLGGVTGAAAALAGGGGLGTHLIGTAAYCLAVGLLSVGPRRRARQSKARR